MDFKKHQPQWQILFHWMTVFSLLGFIHCTTKPRCPSETPHFLETLQEHPHQIWSSNLDTNTRIAIQYYHSRQKIDQNLIYGDSVRSYSLEGKSAQKLIEDFQKKGCLKKDQFLKDAAHQPKLDGQGHPIALITFLCPDGGVLRIKPYGDPLSSYRPQPHASKALRFPHNSPYETFDDERVKIDNFGNVIPKWKKDLRTVHPCHQTAWVESWANAAHTNLVSEHEHNGLPDQEKR